MLPSVRTGTAQAGAAGTITLDSGASAIDSYYTGCIVQTTGGTGGAGGSGSLNNQARVITAYVGSTKVATISPSWETNPDSTTTFSVLSTEFATLVLADVVGWRGTAPNTLQSGRVDSYVGAMAASVIAAATFAANALDAVWATLTSGLTTASTIGKLLVDNVNATISSRLATASYTAPDNATIAAIAGYVDTEVAAIKAKTDLIPAAPAAVADIPTAAQNAAGLLDLAAGIETGITPRQGLRLMLAALVGKLSGAATATVTIRDTTDSKNRVVAACDADGNRSAVTLDAS
ncbi:MAG: hypothetical protein EXS05_18095 [Planctomycetaceae bacterium]|nr:hypothetical protein [Planctomycetaceae bacterium]